MTYIRRIKPDWMYDCKYIDELKDKETAWTIQGGFGLIENRLVIPCDEFCSPIKRGTHNIMIIRSGDIILLKDGEPFYKNDRGRTESIIKYDIPYFSVMPVPFTLEEKIDILWKAYQR